jgi:hypothetical protein
VRLYKREKVNGKNQFIPDCWRYIDYGQIIWSMKTLLLSTQQKTVQ